MKFSVRAFLWITLVVGLVLVVVFNDDFRTRDAMSWIRQAGGDFHYEHEVECQPAPQVSLDTGIRNRIFDEKISGDVAYIYLADANVADSDLVRLREFARLKYLFLTRTKITNDGLRFLQHLESLEMLDLEDTSISDRGLLYLRGMANLKTLILIGTKVTESGVMELQRALPNASIIRGWDKQSGIVY